MTFPSTPPRRYTYPWPWCITGVFFYKFYTSDRPDSFWGTFERGSIFSHAIYAFCCKWLADIDSLNQSESQDWGGIEEGTKEGTWERKGPELSLSQSQPQDDVETKKATWEWTANPLLNGTQVTSPLQANQSFRIRRGSRRGTESYDPFLSPRSASGLLKELPSRWQSPLQVSSDNYSNVRFHHKWKVNHE